MDKRILERSIEKNICLLNKGNERGLDYFYHSFYSSLYHKVKRLVKEDCAATSIVHEAFLRLWLFRKNMHSIDEISTFLHAQVQVGTKVFLEASHNRFYRSLLRIDAVVGGLELFYSHQVAEEEERDIVYLDALDEENHSHLRQLYQLLPILKAEQQLCIRLCLKHGFDYERIGYYLGGISDYEVSRKIEKTICAIRAIVHSRSKMEVANQSPTIVPPDVLDEHQVAIFQMRYELHWSFDQISKSLALSPMLVKSLFVQAHIKIKQSKQTA